MSFGRLRANAWTTRAREHALFHLFSLPGRPIEAALEVRASTLPGHVDGFPHRIGHDDELGWPPILVPPKRQDVGLDRYSGVEHSRKQPQETRG
jgi:hypothetical protein